MSSIYELNAALNMLLDMDQEDQAVIDTLEAIEMESDEKCINIIKYMKHLDDQSEIAKAEIARISAIKASNDKRSAQLKEHVLKNMESREINKIESSLYKITRIKPHAMCEVFDESMIPEKYKTVKTIESIDKKLLLTELKAGEEIKGAKLSESKAGLKY